MKKQFIQNSTTISLKNVLTVLFLSLTSFAIYAHVSNSRVSFVVQETVSDAETCAQLKQQLQTKQLAYDALVKSFQQNKGDIQLKIAIGKLKGEIEALKKKMQTMNCR